MYSICRTVHQPTGIEHCLYANFISPKSRHLIVAGANQLYVYALVTETTVAQTSPATSGGKTHLECVLRSSFNGYVIGMKNIRLPGYSRDCLLFSFSDAKVSLIEYDPSTHDLRTTSMHYFEEDDIRGGLCNNINLPMLRADPGNRCAAMLIFGTHLVILPFQQSSESVVATEFSTASAGSAVATVAVSQSQDVSGSSAGRQTSYVIDLSKMHTKITNVKDMQFLHGYYEPTLFILHEALPTWSGRLAARSDTCSIAAISINIRQRVHPVIWMQEHLPYDCEQVLPVPKPIASSQARLKETRRSEEEHAFLLISRDDSTMVLQTGEEITEVESSHFSTDKPTVCAGNLMDDQLIVQNEQPSLERVAINFAETGTEERVVCGCLYRDRSGLFSTELPECYSLLLQSDGKSQAAPVTASSTDPTTGSAKANSVTNAMDEEDLMLYGSSGADSLDDTVAQFGGIGSAEADDSTESSAATASAGFGLHMSQQPIVRDLEKLWKATSWWLVVIRQPNKVPADDIMDSRLEMYSLPEGQLVFSVANFFAVPQLLVDSSPAADTSGKRLQALLQAGRRRDERGESRESLAPFSELMVCALGSHNSRPLLLALTAHELLIYEAFPYDSGEGRLKLRFKKLPHEAVVYEHSTNQSQPVGSDSKRPYVRRIHPFSNISEYKGVFIGGAYPHWLFMSGKGLLRCHPMVLDGAVRLFTPFHNVNCQHGYLYFNGAAELRICLLPNYLNYDADWPIRKVPLKCTANFVTYHPDSKVYVVAASRSIANNKLMRFEGEGEKILEEHVKPADFVYPLVDEFYLQLYSPMTWEPIPLAKKEFEAQEAVLSMCIATLASDETTSGMKNYLAVGTNCCYGEDLVSKGRCLIIDIIEVVPEPGQPLTKNKLKTVVDLEEKGPVTSVTSCRGFFLMAVGQRIYMSTLKQNELLTCAFVDTDLYVHQMVPLKNFVLVLDVQRSMGLYRVQEHMKIFSLVLEKFSNASGQASLVSREMKAIDSYACQFLIDGVEMEFVMSDREKNVIVFEHQPESRESAAGSKLLRRQDFNLGRHVTHMTRTSCCIRDTLTDPRRLQTARFRHTVVMPDLDGAINYLLPLKEQVYRRLLMLQSVLTTQLSHLAGLNPRAYRAVVMKYPQLQNACKNVIDGDLVYQFLRLGWIDRLELVNRIGTTYEQIMDDFVDLHRMTTLF